MVAKEIRELFYINIGLVSQSKPYVHCRTSVSIARSREKVMQFARRQFLCLAAVGAALPGVLRLARGQAYPSRPVRIVVGFPPGGDMLPRLMGQWLSERLGQPFVIENRPGAGSNIATEMVVNAPPDGYTLLLISPAQAVNATLYEKLNYNFIRDIAPVASFSREPNVMVVNSSVPAKTVPEFIAYVKLHPGRINMASAGNGTSVHVVGELFKMMTGVSMMHVPYRGAALAMTDLLSGQVQVMFATMPSSIAYVRSGKLRALAVTTTTPSAALPDVPAMGDFVPGFEFELRLWSWRTEEHTRRDRRQTQQGDQRRPRRYQYHGANCRRGRHGACRFARRLRQAHRRGNREVGQGDQVRGH